MHQNITSEMLKACFVLKLSLWLLWLSILQLSEDHSPFFLKNKKACVEIQVWNEIFFLMHKIKSEFFLLNELLQNLTCLHTPPKREPQTKHTKPGPIYTVPNAKPFVEVFFCLFSFLFSASSHLTCLGLVWKLSQIDIVFNYDTNYYAYL